MSSCDVRLSGPVSVLRSVGITNEDSNFLLRQSCVAQAGLELSGDGGNF